MYRLPASMLERGIIVILGGLLLGYLASRPGPAVVMLIGGFVVMEIFQPLLFRAGVPAPAVRALGFWKEGLVAVLVAAAVKHRRADPTKPDAIDWLGGAFVMLLTLYWLFPGFLASVPVPIDPQARLVAFRSLALPVVALLAVRHAAIPNVWRRRCLFAALFAGITLAVGGVIEMLFPQWWENFLVNTVGLLRYQAIVRGSVPRAILNFANFQESQIQRSGSWYADPLITGFAYHLPLAAALTLAVIRGRPRVVFVLVLIASGLLLTQGRAAILASVVIVVAAFRHRDEGAALTRTKLGLAVAAFCILALPVLAETALGARIAGIVNGDDDVATPIHVQQSRSALARVIALPLGTGLGSSGGTSVRFQSAYGEVSENHFLGVGLDVGIPGMVLYVLLLATVVKRGRRGAGDAVAFAAVSGLFATAVGGLFLHSLESPVVAFPAFVAAGLAVVARPDQAEATWDGYEDGAAAAAWAPTNALTPAARRGAALRLTPPAPR